MRNLLHVLQRLTDGGNTVVVIEHHIDVMLNADHIIDLGPQGGYRGGEIVAQGTPEHVAQSKESLTAEHLRHAFARRAELAQAASKTAKAPRKPRAKQGAAAG